MYADIDVVIKTYNKRLISRGMIYGYIIISASFNKMYCIGGSPVLHEKKELNEWLRSTGSTYFKDVILYHQYERAKEEEDLLIVNSSSLII